MDENVFIRIQSSLKELKLDPYAEEIASFFMRSNFSEEQIDAVAGVLNHLETKKREKIVTTLLKMSRLPLKEPKSFENFDFEQIHGKEAGILKNLSTLAALHAKRNIIFIGPEGTGKTHLAMAFGRECCCQGYKAYFLKATELKQKFEEAIRFGHEAQLIRGLVKHSSLIIDEIGRCVFDKTSTRLFFDMIDRRYQKEGSNNLILTSNVPANNWGEFFQEDASLLPAMDRIFDNATVITFKGESYRGKFRKSITLNVGEPPLLPGSHK